MSIQPNDPTYGEETVREQALTILMVASEAMPYVKTGGLADVTGALTTALDRLGHKVTLVMPLYRAVGWAGAPFARRHLAIGGHWYDVGFVETAFGPRSRVVFVECDELYDRDGVYGEGDDNHPDNALRFALLARAALEFTLLDRTPPDIIHAHDWQAGLVPVYARTLYAKHPMLDRIALVFTIHNIAYQGIFGGDTAKKLDLGPESYTIKGLEFWNQTSFLKGGINFSDLVTTVSQGYAREILTEEYGYGFEGIMQERRSVLRGILNGIDVDKWNPTCDPHVPEPFSANDLRGKRAAKRKLLEEYGLPSSEADLSRPVVGLVSRLVYQKGVDLISEAIDQLAVLGPMFVVLGAGERRYADMWREAAGRYPRTIGVRIGYDEALAHLIEAGADMFLMPSRYEPCGLNQMYSMRYGTVPIVRATGGLDDAVERFDERSGRGTGFKFRDYTSVAMLGALREALIVFADQDRWRRIQIAGMRRDFSWDISAAAYVTAYHELSNVRRSRGEFVGCERLS